MTANFKTISRMLGALGPSLDIVEIAAYEASNRWLIVIDNADRSVLTLDHLAAEDKVNIRSELCPISPERILAAHVALSEHVLSCRRKDGVRLELDEANARVLLSYETAASAMTEETLKNALPIFIAHINAFRTFMQADLSEIDAIFLLLKHFNSA